MPVTTAGPAGPPLQLLTETGAVIESDATAPYWERVTALGLDRIIEGYREMVVIRAFDTEATNLQRQGQLALWVPSLGQEGGQVGSALATKPRDHVFPAYREHVVVKMRGVDPQRILEMLRGLDHGGWDPKTHNNCHLYTLVIGAQSLHATGYAMGIKLDGSSGTGDPERDEAVIAYFGDGATSQGDVSESLVFSASYQAPIVFFLQNNHWAISVPVSRQSRTPFAQRAAGFGIPSLLVDGNDMLASYAATDESLSAARSGNGPRFIEALTYRMGAHTTTDDPTRYRLDDELEYWRQRDPIVRMRAYLESQDVDASVFAEADEAGRELAAETRRRTMSLGNPDPVRMFDNVYTDPHPALEAQREWFVEYEATMGEQR